MRILILTTDYPGFLSQMYQGNSSLRTASHADQVAARAATLFGVADFHSKNLVARGHEAVELFANNEYLQRAWAREKGMTAPGRTRWEFHLRRGILPSFRRVRDERWFVDILAAQIRRFQPDVLWNQAMWEIPPPFIRDVKKYCRRVIGQIASPVLPAQDWRCYDLVLSSLPNLVAYFREQGVKAVYQRLGFEASVADRIQPGERDVGVSFVGSLTGIHQRRGDVLRWLAPRVPIEIWGEGAEGLGTEDPLLARHRGQAFGTAMYRILARSRLTLNVHLDIAREYANNMRLYEATGMGACLVTDWKENLAQMFEPEKEVVSYRSVSECLEKIQHYLANPGEAAAIAEAGRKRTLAEHTYAHRAAELGEILDEMG